MTRSLWLIALLATGGCSEAPRMAGVARAPGEGRAIVFRNVAVFDGASLLPHRDVLVTDGTIRAVAEAGSVPVPADAIELPGSGRTLLPGLVDSHAHLFSAGEKGGPPPAPEAIAQAFLFAGVTTLLVAAGTGEEVELRQARAEGSVLAPHLYTAGPGLTAPGGHPIPLLRALLPWPVSVLAARGIPVAASAQEARERVREIASERQPELIKISYDDLPPGSPHLAREAMQAAIDESRALGLRPVVHTTTPEDSIAAAEAGAALLMHAPQRGLLGESDARRLAESGVPVVSTVRLVAASHELARRGAIPLERAMFGPDLLDPWIEAPEWELEGFSEEIDRTHDSVARETRDNVRRLLEAGVPLLVGTDSGVHGVFPGASIHEEIRTLVELGMPPLRALEAATSAPAAFLDPSGSFGRIAPGQRADLLLVNGDPVADIAALSNIEAVFLEGVRLDRIPISEGEGAAPER